MILYVFVCIISQIKCLNQIMMLPEILRCLNIFKDESDFILQYFSICCLFDYEFCLTHALLIINDNC